MFEVLKERIENIFKKLGNKGKLTEEDVRSSLREIRRALLEADVNYKVVKDFIKRVEEKAIGERVLSSITPAQQVLAIVYEELIELMGSKPCGISFSPKPPTIIMMVGLQGSGKTTTCAKLAKRISSSHKPLLVAADLRRPAAVKQLEVLSKQANVGFYGPKGKGEDVVSVVKGSLDYAKENLYDVIIVDTAGRLHIDEELMKELEVLKEVLLPCEILLVVDAMTGQEAVNVAKEFNDRLNLTGLILTKLDGDARGGAALSARAVTGVPIKFVGVGEKIGDLEPFSPNRMASRILGMGDIEGIVEKVKEAAKEEDLKQMAQKLKKAEFTMEDFLKQLENLRNMGGISALLEMLPGNLSKALRGVDIDEKRLKHIEAIILSMTPEERRKPEIIKSSRKKRIARGSGTSVQLVNQVLKQYFQMKEMLKGFSKKKRRFMGLPKDLFGF